MGGQLLTGLGELERARELELSRGREFFFSGLDSLVTESFLGNLGGSLAGDCFSGLEGDDEILLLFEYFNVPDS